MAKFRVYSWGSTDVGMKRDHNEDSYLLAPDLNLYIVADGMGGHAGGEMASGISVRTVEKHVRLNKQLVDPNVSHDGRIENSPVARLLSDAVRGACNAVFQKSQQVRELQGMGTTTTSILFHDRHAFVAHVGDSRAYLIRDKNISRITNDHSWVFEQVQAGMLTEAEAEKHPLRNVITRALGGALSVNPDAAEVESKAGDVYLLCSDGLTGMVPEDEILRIVTAADNVDDACQQLIDVANERGGLDNVTAILVKTG
jgi:protein phosphatase